MRKILIILFIQFGFTLSLIAQTLTISSSGQTGTSGTNWSISANTLTVTGTANIRASVIQDYLTNTGPLEVVGNTSSFAVTVSEAITVASGGNGLVFGASGNTGTITTNSALSINGSISIHGGVLDIKENLITTGASADILLKSIGNIAIAGGTDGSNYRTVQTNNGDIILWANAAGSTNGGIEIGDWATFNSANGATSQSTGGGKVWLAGGTTVNGDGLPTGPSIGTGNNIYGVRFGSLSPGATTTSIHSGGGDIYIHGEAGAANGAVYWNRTGIADAGNGTVTIKGTAKTATTIHGIELGAFSGSMTINAGGGDASNPAIYIEGSTERSNFSGVQTSGGTMQATGTGGITILGTGPTGGTYWPLYSTMDILAASGDILLSAEGGTTLAYGGTLGKKDATSVTISSSNITIRGNGLTVNTGITVDGTGQFVVEPFGSAFTSALTWPISGFTLGSDISGLRIGKEGNTANITIGQAQTIAGDFTLHGGALALNAAITATNADINLHASGNVTQTGALTANRLGLHGLQ